MKINGLVTSDYKSDIRIDVGYLVRQTNYLYPFIILHVSCPLLFIYDINFLNRNTEQN